MFDTGSRSSNSCSRPHTLGSIFIWLVTIPPEASGMAVVSSQHDNNKLPPLPMNANDVIRQAANAISCAFLDDNLNRQTIKLPLSDAMYGNKEEGFVADRAIGWQGGPQETLRFLSPLAKQLLKEIRTVPNREQQQQQQQQRRQHPTGGLPPRLKEQILLDFDGSSLLTAESPMGPLGDIQAMLQPNTDDYYFNTIATIEEQFSDTPNKSKRLFLLLNPAWRDSSSWGLFSAKKAQTRILDRYEITYALDQFVVRGQKLNLLKVWPYDWCVYQEPMPYEKKKCDEENEIMKPKLLGSFKNRPKYKQMDELLLRA